MILERLIHGLPLEIRQYICQMVISRNEYIYEREMFMKRCKKLNNRKLKRVYLDTRYMSNKVDVLHLYRNDPRCYKYIDRTLLRDSNFFIQLLSINTLVIRDMPKEFADNRQILQCAIDSNKHVEESIYKYFSIKDDNRIQLPRKSERHKKDVYQRVYYKNNKSKKSVKYIRLKDINV
jgi:hypothetical protein